MEADIHLDTGWDDCVDISRCQVRYRRGLCAIVAAPGDQSVISAKKTRI